MNKVSAYLGAIRDVYPALNIASATLKEQGQNNDVLVAWCDGG